MTTTTAPEHTMPLWLSEGRWRELEPAEVDHLLYDCVQVDSPGAKHIAAVIRWATRRADDITVRALPHRSGLDVHVVMHGIDGLTDVAVGMERGSTTRFVTGTYDDAADRVTWEWHRKPVASLKAVMS